MKVVITVMSSGYNVLVEGPQPLVSGFLSSEHAKWARVEALRKQTHFNYPPIAPGTEPPPAPAPTEPLAAAFSTLDEVQRYLREQFGLDGDTVCASNTLVGANGPDMDWQARDSRQTALNYAVGTGKPDWTPKDVLSAAHDYEMYIRGDTVTVNRPDEMLAKTNPDNI